MYIKETGLDFPCGLVVKNLPANAGNMSLIPGPGRSHRPWGNKAHAPQLLRLRSRVCVPQILKAVSRAWAPQQEELQQWEARAPQLESSPLIITKESPSSTAQNQQMSDFFFFFKWQRQVWVVCKERRALGVEEWRAAWDWPRESGVPETRGTESSRFVSYSFYL